MIHQQSPMRRLPLLMLALAAHVPQTSAAQEGPEVRAARVCAGLRYQDIKGNGTFEVDGVKVKGNSNGTYTLTQNGVDMGNIEKPTTYDDYVACLKVIIELITTKEAPPTSLPPSPPASSRLLPGINIPGQDYAGFRLGSADSRLCQNACRSDAKCVAWTYVQPGVQDEQALCWLKNQVPPREDVDARCISGIEVAQ